MSEADPLLVRRIQRGAVLFGALAALLALTALLGWLLDLPALKSIAPGLASMKVNTAASLLLCGSAICLKSLFPDRSRPDRLAQLCALAVSLIALATLAQYALGIDLHIDQLFFLDPATSLASHPGRMSIATACCLLAAGASLILLDRVIRLAQALAILVALTSLLAFLGYAYGITALYQIKPFSTVALHTAIGLFLTSLGILMARPRRCFHQLLTSSLAGGVLARRLLPASLLVPLLLGWLILQGQKAGHYIPEFSLALFALSNIIFFLLLVAFNAFSLERADRLRRRVEADRDDLLHRERAARERAETALLARQHLLNVVSHELRTPLNPVLMLTTAMEMEPSLAPDVRRHLQTIREQIQIETRLIDDLLDWVSLGSGKLVLKTRPVNLHDLLRDLAALFAPRFRAADVAFTLDLAAARIQLDADAGRLQQIVRNLLGNCLKFTPAGGTVTLRSANDPSGAFLLQITDTGIGLKPETLQKLFGAFEQGDASITRRYGGLGIGLAIAKTLAELHGGDLSAASPGENQGAAFTLRLPNAHLPSAAPAPASPLPDIPAPAARLRLLVVEDNAETLRSMERLLKILGHDVLSAASALQALETARSAPFDLLISDIGLPDVSGWELMRRLRQSQPVKGIAVSGFVTDDDRRKSAEAGFLAHLAKPIAIRQLADAISRAASQQPAPAGP